VLAEAKPSNVINLMDALRRSARADRRQSTPARKSGSHRKRSNARRRVKKAS
jgi:non-homologous end joining protein Ku